jgi:hypothetical protein
MLYMRRRKNGAQPISILCHPSGSKKKKKI